MVYTLIFHDHIIVCGWPSIESDTKWRVIKLFFLRHISTRAHIVLGQCYSTFFDFTEYFNILNLFFTTLLVNNNRFFLKKLKNLKKSLARRTYRFCSGRNTYTKRVQTNIVFFLTFRNFKRPATSPRVLPSTSSRRTVKLQRYRVRCTRNNEQIDDDGNNYGRARRSSNYSLALSARNEFFPRLVSCIFFSRLFPPGVCSRRRIRLRTDVRLSPVGRTTENRYGRHPPPEYRIYDDG